MKHYVTTRSGSIYLVDADNMTWERTVQTEKSGPLRTDGGDLEAFYDMELGKCLILLGPPIRPYTSGRIILTTEVVEIRHVVQFANNVAPE